MRWVRSPSRAARKGTRSLFSANVLHGVRVLGEPVALRTRRTGSAEGADLPIHTARELAAAQAAAQAAGFAAGEAQARTREAERLRTLVRAFETAAGALASQRGELLQEARTDLVRLAVAMAERLARRALTIDPQVAERALAEALDLAGRARQVIVRLHPGDAQRIQAALASDASLLPADRFELRPDPEVGLGGCIVDTAEMRFDATLEAHLERFAEALTDWRDHDTLVQVPEVPAMPAGPVLQLEPEGSADAGDEEVADAA
jgi:flagellar biosynthesis/type III secretory pathway protein FliH